jgi:hypothetical protein
MVCFCLSCFVVCYRVLSCVALLTAFTYDVRTRQYTRLMTVQESPLGAAYRNLTGLSTTTHTSSHSGNGSTSIQQSSTSGSTAGAAAVAPAAAAEAARLHKQHAAGPATRRQVQAPLAGCAAAAAANHRSPHVGRKPKRAGAAAASTPPPPAAVPSIFGAAGVPAAEQSARSSPRMLGYAVPLQPIRPTDSLVAAAAADMHASSGPSGCALTASGLQFHVSVLARFPFLVKELAASELQQAAADEQAAAISPTAAGADERADATCCDCSSGGVSCSQGTGDDCVVVSLPPCTLHGQPQVNSLDAYVSRHKLQQVRGSGRLPPCPLQRVCGSRYAAGTCGGRK